MADYRIGKKYPGAVPEEDGAVLIIEEDGGLSALCTYSGITSSHITAFESEQVPYGCIEYTRNFPLAILIFRFPSPIDQVELPFNLKAEKPGIQNKFFMELQNRIVFYLVNRKTKILKAIKAMSVDHSLIEALQTIATKQLLFTGSYTFKSELDTVHSKFMSSLVLWSKAKKYG